MPQPTPTRAEAGGAGRALDASGLLIARRLEALFVDHLDAITGTIRKGSLALEVSALPAMYLKAHGEKLSCACEKLSVTKKLGRLLKKLSYARETGLVQY